jgi:putative tricarboxylic transport membrane protein
MLSALVMAVTAFLAILGVAKAPVEPLVTGENLRQSFVRRITPPVFVLFALAVVAFMLLLNKLGFVVSAYLFLVVSMRLLGSVRWLFNLMLSAISLGVVYLIFQTIFSVILPKGTWWAGVWA